MVELSQIDIESVSGGYDNSRGAYCGEAPSNVTCHSTAVWYTDYNRDFGYPHTDHLYRCILDQQFTRDRNQSLPSPNYKGSSSLGFALVWMANITDLGCNFTLNYD